jgi:prephenate dehydrogenase
MAAEEFGVVGLGRIGGGLALQAAAKGLPRNVADVQRGEVYQIPASDVYVIRRHQAL